MLLWLMNLDFAGGSVESVVWTVQSNSTDTWTNQSDSSDTWTIT